MNKNRLINYKPSSNIGLAIISLFFFWPTAIVAIMNATKVNSKYNNGDQAGAEKASDKAKKWGRLSIAISVLMNAVIFGLILPAVGVNVIPGVRLLCYIILGVFVAYLLVKLIPQKLAIPAIILLVAFSGYLGYRTYNSIQGPIAFNKVKVARYAKVIDKLKDVRDSQLAYKTVTGKYAKNFNSLIAFIDTAQFTITQRRDSSYMEYDETYRIDMKREVVITDTIGHVPVKDSLFGTDTRYRDMMNVPFAKNNEKFEMAAGTIEKSNIKIPVFEAKVKKDVVLHDQSKALLKEENRLVSVQGINGDAITVGSLTEATPNGNWPSIYDGKDEQ